jgi:hypothetical protein
LLRALFRLCGFLLIAAGFVAAVMDGARSIAHSGLDYAKLGETGMRLLGERFLLIQPAVERHVHPLLWDPVLLTVLLAPTSLLLLLLGLGLYRLGKRADPAIGHLLRS